MVLRTRTFLSLALAALLLAVGCLSPQPVPPPQEEFPRFTGDVEVEDIGEFVEDYAYLPDGPAALLEVLDNRIKYSGADGIERVVPLHSIATAGNSTLIIDGTLYLLRIDFAQRTLQIENDFTGEQVFFSGYTPHTVSDNTVELAGLGGDAWRYHFLVEEGELQRVHFLLAVQSVTGLYEKTLHFEGTDTDGDGMADLEYYMPPISEEFTATGGTMSGRLGVFSADQDGDGALDLRFYIEPVAGRTPSVEQLGAVPGVAHVFSPDTWVKAENLKGLYTTPYGTRIEVQESGITLRIPKES